jgi:hypothetical protein
MPKPEELAAHPEPWGTQFSQFCECKQDPLELLVPGTERNVRPNLESNASPAGDVGTLDLRDIIDVAAVQSLMDDSYSTAGIPMSIVDLQGELLVGVGWQEICTKFHRAHPETCKHCVESGGAATIASTGSLD